MSGVSCAAHGVDLPEAYVCRHLLDGTGEGWHDAETDELCPDAWCDACEQLRLANDGWEGSDVDIRLLCACCYHEVRGRQQASKRWTWDALVLEATSTMQARNDALDAAHDLFRHAWHYDAPPLVLTFHDGGNAVARCRALPVGSFSENRGTFLWGWANRSNDAVDRAPVAAVSGEGVFSQLEELTDAVVDCELVDAWERAAVGAFLLGARGLYRCPSDPLHIFLALMDIEPVQAEAVDASS